MAIVQLETFLDIYNLVLGRVDEDTPDFPVESMIKDAINHAYDQIVKRNRRYTSTVAVVVNGIATLPDDLVSIEKITPLLVSGEYRKGNAIFSPKGTQFTIVYSASPERLVKDTDVPDVPKRFFYIMSSYACYVYYIYRKKPQIAPMYLQEYKGVIDDTEEDNIPEIVEDYYLTAASTVDPDVEPANKNIVW